MKGFEETHDVKTLLVASISGTLKKKMCVFAFFFYEYNENACWA